MYEKMLELLTDNYNKSPNSNIGKLFEIVNTEIEELQDTFTKINEWRDIDNAQGQALDRIGHNVLEYRPSNNDRSFQQLIKTKIIANLSKGDIETINEVAQTLIGDSFMGVQETWINPDFNYEPAGLIFTMGSRAKIIPNAIIRVIAGGVGVYWILVLKEENDIHIGNCMLFGEDTLVVPRHTKETHAQGKHYYGFGDISMDTTIIYPRHTKEMSNISKTNIVTINDVDLDKTDLYPKGVV